MNIPRPLNDTIIVVEEEIKRETTSGIHLPDAFTIRVGDQMVGKTRIDNDLRKGTVVAVGPGRLYPNGSTTPLSLESGDFITFGRLSGVELVFEGSTYLVMSEKDVLCVYEQTEA
jgi:chaperonin GroES